ncbi:Prefoldin subunit 2 [Oopsacas minuta]|uniref:Prefoldin subunit 2 n=1 Tax=Oopsacas minuta TaxID=111878 RepID=A0AAV7KJR2_9METZ|nr:Prefoldin subunit 2 [Oopsacas minuta]
MASSGTKKSKEEIVQHFQKLRSEQRSIAVKISEIEVDQNEHKLVIETLKELDPERKCFRMVGGVLVERDVVSVLPGLCVNYDKMGLILIKLNEQLLAKGKEINAYKDEYQIKVEGENDEKEIDTPSEKKTIQGVLV